ncbi:MAG: hypothetical protein BroJett040_09570 [Oligoflexia bacterium]|nr:MAG: hypothetical protein BroJett040_09570 [Oligoflexia bacterium]
MSAAVARPFIFTTIGRKYLMGISGLIWAGFVLSHMAANLLIIFNPQAYNSYGHALTSGNFIYVAEAILVLAIVTHVICGISLTRENLAARGSSRYAMTPNGEKGASLASKTMAPQGALILAFIISHIATFKYGTYYETSVGGVVMRDLHRLVVEVFKQPGYMAWYVVCLVLLGFHLSHGIGAIFQSLGLRNDKYACLIKKISVIYAVIVAAGFLVQPIYVFFIAG